MGKDFGEEIASVLSSGVTPLHTLNLLRTGTPVSCFLLFSLPSSIYLLSLLTLYTGILVEDVLPALRNHKTLQHVDLSENDFKITDQGFSPLLPLPFLPAPYSLPTLSSPSLLSLPSLLLLPLSTSLVPLSLLFILSPSSPHISF